tara:strand:+ start:5532 stop:6242 length:711 start_codon:yes stop_codon:yes gene_type:complete
MKKLTIEAYTHNKQVYEHQPMTNKQFKPSWWKNLATMYKIYHSKSGIMVPTPTVKACPGITQYMQKAIIMRLWADTIFRVQSNGKVSCVTPLHSGEAVQCGIHERSQHGEDLYPGYTVCKLESPWYFKASDNSSFMNSEYHYSEELRKEGILVAPGVLNFHDQHATNVFLLFPLKDETYEVELKYNTPLMALFPMTDKPIEFKNHYVPKHEWNELNNVFPSTFLGRYYARKHTTAK